MAKLELSGRKMDGYERYLFTEDGKCYDLVDNKEIKVNKKGVAPLLKDDGTKSPEVIAEIVSALYPQEDELPFEDLEQPEPQAIEVPVLTPEEAARIEAHNRLGAETKTLNDKKKKLQKEIMAYVLGKDKNEEERARMANEMMEIETRIDEIKKELKSHTLTSLDKAKKEKVQKETIQLSAEAIAAQERYNKAKKELDEATALVRNMKRSGYIRLPEDAAKDKSTKGDFGYLLAQRIRRDYAIGRYGDASQPAMTKGQIAEKYSKDGVNVSEQAVYFYVHYLQRKLKKAPEGTDMSLEDNKLMYTAFTPLVNQFYPEWKVLENGRAGAPYQEDGIKETVEKYTVPTPPASDSDFE